MNCGIKPGVRFTWNISYDCNYRCSYCFFDGKWEEYKKRNIYLSPEDWMKYWNRIHEIYGQIFLVITGGEPMVYPDFIDLIKKLSQVCFHINISTNSSANLEKFVEEVNPESVSISLSFQREFDTLDSFIERVKLIRRYNFKGCLNLVAYPPFLRRLEDDKKKLIIETQEEFKIIPFFGKYQNVEYPKGYTPEERRLIGIDDNWFAKVHRKGSLCSAGYTSALVFPEGKVARCGQIGERFLLGNFFDPDFRLYDKPMVCDAEYCPCQEDSIEGEGESRLVQKKDSPINKDSHITINKEADKLDTASVSTLTINDASKTKETGLLRVSKNLAHPNTKIRFAWDIHYKCNFRCPYCWFYKEWARLGQRSLYLRPDEWMVHWKRIFDKYGEAKIEIVGGEPFIYPNFIELVKRLSSLHLIKITSNLSGNVERFVQEVSPERVELDLNFHILFIDLETVIKKTLILKKAGFKGGICYLAYPPQMHKIKSLSERFQKEDINFALAAFWGEYNGKKYPAAYTDEEKEIMRPFLGDVDRIIYHLNAQSPKGKLCNAGYTYADIQADGKVVRCAQLGDKAMGNITDENFKLLEKALPCESDSCPCNEYINLTDENYSNESSSNNRVNPEGQWEHDKEGRIVLSVTEKDEPREVKSLLPKFPRKAPPYRVHWNWELGLSCNYKCSYCHVWPKGKDERYTLLGIKSWKDIWDRMFEKYWCCHIRFSGGEPTIYPGFFDIVSVLLEKHTVDITTNLSFNIKSLTDKVKPGGISISASFHPEYNKIESFLEKALFLHNNDYPSTIAYVAYPPYLKEIEAAKSLVESNKILFKIIPYQGEYEGRKYPESYTIQERILIEGLSVSSQDTHLNDLNSRWYDWNVKRDKETKEKKGSLCRMGQMYAKIFPDGRIARCCALDKNGAPLGILGHIADLDFRLLDEPMPCLAEHCPCFKSMLVGFEEDKWLPLWEALEHPEYKTEYIKDILFKTKEPLPASTSLVTLNNNETKSITIEEKNSVNRQSIQPHRVFFTWDIHYACNYRCEYCFFARKWEEVAKENRYPDIDDWKRIWDNLFVRYGSGHIHFSGGEPFTYPSFIDLVAYLAQEYTVEFDTNLAFDMGEFLAKIKPGRVKFATAFHPTFIDFETYFKKVMHLKKEGFDIGVNYVAYPLQLNKMKEYKTAFEKNQLSFTIMPFRGEFQGRTYPQGYTEVERDLIKACDTNLTISAKMLEWYGGNKFSRTGKLCRMGQMYTKIHPNGDAYRCCYIQDKNKLGNIIDGTFSLLDEVKPCENPECSCWTAMVIGQEEEWMSHWVIPKLFEPKQQPLIKLSR
jgi:molybdenum cofactor biosynthesis enzyme MoaA